MYVKAKLAIVTAHRLRLSYAEIARRSGVPWNTVRLLMAGRISAKEPVIAKVAAELGMDPETLTDYERSAALSDRRRRYDQSLYVPDPDISMRDYWREKAMYLNKHVILRRLADLHWSTKDLAEKAGLSAAHVSRICHGKVGASFDTALCIAVMLELPLKSIMRPSDLRPSVFRKDLHPHLRDMLDRQHYFDQTDTDTEAPEGAEEED